MRQVAIIQAAGHNNILHTQYNNLNLLWRPYDKYMCNTHSKTQISDLKPMYSFGKGGENEKNI